MQLRVYLDGTGETYEAFAERVNAWLAERNLEPRVTPRALESYGRGARHPRPGIAYVIVQVTDGLVTHADLYDGSGLALAEKAAS